MTARSSPHLLDEFVREYWTPLAAAAWHGYVRFGRGAVLVSPQFMTRLRGGEERWRPAYVVSATVSTVSALIARYDPDETIVIVSLPDVPPPPVALGDTQIERRTVRPGESFEAGVFRYLPRPRMAHGRLAS